MHTWGQQIEDALGDGAEWGARIVYSPEDAALETAGGIANALPLLGSASFLVVNGDVFTEVDYANLKFELSMRTLAHLVMVDNPPQHPRGDFTLQEGTLKEDGKAKLTFSGVGVYSPALFKDVIRGEAAKLAPILKKAMVDGLVTGEHYQGVWHDVGTPERLDKLDALLRNT